MSQLSHNAELAGTHSENTQSLSIGRLIFNLFYCSVPGSAACLIPVSLFALTVMVQPYSIANNVVERTPTQDIEDARAITLGLPALQKSGRIDEYDRNCWKAAGLLEHAVNRVATKRETASVYRQVALLKRAQHRNQTTGAWDRVLGFTLQEIGAEEYLAGRNCAASYHRTRHDYARALAVHDQTLKECASSCDSQRAMVAACTRTEKAVTLLANGKFAESLAVSGGALDALSSEGARADADLAQLHFLRAQALIAMAQPAKALGELTDALTSSSSMDTTRRNVLRFQIHRAQMIAHNELGDVENGTAAYKECLKLSEHVGVCKGLLKIRQAICLFNQNQESASFPLINEGIAEMTDENLLSPEDGADVLVAIEGAQADFGAGRRPDSAALLSVASQRLCADNRVFGSLGFAFGDLSSWHSVK